MSRLLTWRPQFSITNLILATLIVALCLAWWHEHQQHSQAKYQILSEQRRNAQQSDEMGELRDSLSEFQVEEAVGREYKFRHMYRELRQHEKAIAVFEKVVAARTKYQSPNHRKTLRSTFYLGEVYNLAGRPDKAEHYLETYVENGRVIGLDSSALIILGGIRGNQGRFQEAEELLRECVNLRQQSAPGKWWTLNAKSKLGEILVELGELSEAETLLIEGYEGLRDSKAGKVVVGKYRTNATKRIVALYEEWDRPEEAARWRKELERVEAHVGLFGGGLPAPPY